MQSTLYQNKNSFATASMNTP